ncbi:T6SS immunity protein Tli4 family protein [Pyxidicoccus sp. MSG2]|uniref:T6SS immunity protein Tli4 family protein n=1 Tax=Pyxidicoccus sp. MSG2 TaxID=2996790 RepID=UPI003B63B2A6
MAGLPGEELILRTSEKKRQKLRFLWSYAGKEDSGTHPKFTIELETSLDQEDAKVAFWDAMLDSVRPVGQ